MEELGTELIVERAFANRKFVRKQTRYVQMYSERSHCPSMAIKKISDP